MPSLKIHVRNLEEVHSLYALQGHELRFVGGGVRDMLLGLIPKDMDLATTMPADQGLSLLQEHGIHCIPTGLSHGTITVVINHIGYEITTLRKDVATDGRWAHVHYTDDWEEDAARRDFTMNALYQDFEGKLYDYFNAQDDLRHGIIRFIGNPEARILEDYLRILRLFRFYARYGKQEIDQETLLLCQKHAQNLTKLSLERVTQEIFFLLSTENCIGSVILMDSYNILDPIFSVYDVNRLKRITNREKLFSLEIDPLRRLYALSTDHQRLRLSRVQVKYLKNLDSLRQYPDLGKGCHDYEQNKSVRGLLYYLCLTIGKTYVVDYLLIELSELFPILFSELLNLEIPPFPIKGKDLLKVGYSPGPEIHRVLADCEFWWCQQHFEPDYEACMAYVMGERKLPLF